MSVTSAPAAGVRSDSLFARVGRQLEGLAGLLGLESEQGALMRAHHLLCADAGAYPLTGRPPRRSALNADGTPIQLSLTLGASSARLQLLSDVGDPELSPAARMSVARSLARELAELCGVEHAPATVDPLLETLAPARDRQLLAEPAGAIWLGAGVARGRAPTMKLYVNARWGAEAGRWARLSGFAAGLGASDPWRAVHELVRGELEPLGVAFGARAGAALAGRIYLAGYGRAWSYLERLAGGCGGPAFARHVQGLGRSLRRADYAYPTRSLVFSVGIQDGRLADVKLELCGHCVFDSDRQARERCHAWLSDDRLAAGTYGRAVELLSGGSLSHSQTALHGYLGVGSRGERTIYFNPGASTPPGERV